MTDPLDPDAPSTIELRARPVVALRLGAIFAALLAGTVPVVEPSTPVGWTLVWLTAAAILAFVVKLLLFPQAALTLRPDGLRVGDSAYVLPWEHVRSAQAERTTPRPGSPLQVVISVSLTASEALQRLPEGRDKKPPFIGHKVRMAAVGDGARETAALIMAYRRAVVGSEPKSHLP